MTLQFIRADHSDDFSLINNEKIDRLQAMDDQIIRSENHLAEILTVNASACEFMMLILKQVEKLEDTSNRIAHFIIRPLIDTFYNLIQKKKNYAMQVNIINLLQFILNECNFQGNKNVNTPSEIERINKSSVEILKDYKLIHSIILGLKCD